MSLVLNFSPVQFDDREITVGRLPYGSDGDQVLEQLRLDNYATHVFRRAGADSIFAVAVAAGAEPIGIPETIRLKEHLGLVAALVRNSLLNCLYGLGRTSLLYEPLQVISHKDLLRCSCPEGTEPPDWLGVQLLYEVAIRPVYFAGLEPMVAAMLDVRTTRRIERSAAQLIEDGLPIEGAYVGRWVPSKDPRIAPEFELLGCVQRVEGARLLLTDSRDGIEAVDADEATPAKDFFAACLAHVFGERATEITGTLERHRAALRHGPNRLERIKTLLDSVKNHSLELATGVPFAFGDLLDGAMPRFPSLRTAPKPLYVFGSGSKTHKWHDEGINTHGPYSANVETRTPPRICVICQRSLRTSVDQFLRKFFFHGVALSSSSRHRHGPPPKNYFEKGLCAKYALGTVQPRYFFADANTADAYSKACREALEENPNGRPDWDLAIVQIQESFHELPAECNPYFAAKLIFQTHQIPVQEFEIETTRYWGSRLSFCLNNMGLATYAKIGGIPWLLDAGGHAHELVIGLGAAEVGEGRLAKRERFVGITTIFRGDGFYHLSNLSKAVARNEYQEELLKSLRAAVQSIVTGMNCKPGGQILLVFHTAFKRFSDEEVQAVAELIAEFSDYDVKYAFVQLSERHPYMAFDTSQEGVKDFDSGCIKGQYAPARGRYLPLGNRQTLLFLTGAREVKRPEDGTPRPVLLTLHRDSTFTEMQYLTEQVFAFACHSWRTFLPVSLPVTIQYGNLIANSLGKLSRLARWNPDVMLGQIGRSRWFL